MTIHTYHAQNKELKRLDLEGQTLDEITLETEHGVYAVFRTYEGNKVVRLQRHFDRMRNSCHLLEIPYHIEDDWLRTMVRNAVEQSGFNLSRIRVAIPYSSPDSAFITVEPFSPPSKDHIENGVHIELTQYARTNPLVKDTRFITDRSGIQESFPDAYEILLYDDKENLLEGAGSNFYGVLNGELRTSPDGVLQGIAKSILLEIAPPIIPVNHTAMTLGDIPHLSEAMLTTASRAIVPIVQIGQVTIGNGKPGPITYQLLKAFNDRVDQEKERL